MKAASKIGLLVLGIGAAALGACEKSTNRETAGPTSAASRDPDFGIDSFANELRAEPSRAAKPAVGGGPPEIRQMTGGEAMWNIATARCDHELVCQRIGPSHKYKTREQCVAAVQKDNGGNFTAQSCPNGVSQLGLTDCVRAIRQEACDGRSIERKNACLAEKFCTPATPGAPQAGSGSGSG
jgi:hypothetical protein